MFVLLGNLPLSVVGGNVTIYNSEFDKHTMIRNHTFEDYGGSAKFDYWSESGYVSRSSTSFYNENGNTYSAYLYSYGYSTISQSLQTSTMNIVKGENIRFSFYFRGSTNDQVRGEISYYYYGWQHKYGPWMDASTDWHANTLEQYIPSSALLVTLRVTARDSAGSYKYVRVDETTLTILGSTISSSSHDLYGDFGLGVEVIKVADVGNIRQVWISLSSVFATNEQYGEQGAWSQNGYVMEEVELKATKNNNQQTLTLLEHSDGTDVPGVHGIPPLPREPFLNVIVISLAQAIFWTTIGLLVPPSAPVTLTLGIAALSFATGEYIGYERNSLNDGAVEEFSGTGDNQMKNTYTYSPINVAPPYAWDVYSRYGSTNQLLLWSIPMNSGTASLSFNVKFVIGEMFDSSYGWEPSGGTTLNFPVTLSIPTSSGGSSPPPPCGQYC